MPNVPITPEKEGEIIVALEKDFHASRVARTLGDVSYATVWRVAHRYGIALTTGRETMGRRLAAERRAAVIAARRANPDAPQNELRSRPGSAARACGGSRAMAAARGAVRQNARLDE